MGMHYLIGHGERLSEPIVLPHGGNKTKDIYTYEESRERLRPELHAAIANLPKDPEIAPDDVHVLQFVLHPKYLAKSYHPSGLIKMVGLSLVGSKPTRITTSDTSSSDARLSRTLLVAGRRQSLEHFDSLLQDPDLDRDEYSGIGDIVKIERISNYTSADKYHPAPPNDDWYELVLHQLDTALAPDNVRGFLALAGKLGVEVEDEMNFQSNDLLYLPIHGSEGAVKRLAEYTSVRALRPMPRLKLEPIGTGVRAVRRPVELPKPPDAPTSIDVAVLDGGLPPDNLITPWVNYIKANPDADDDRRVLGHGLGVCSALLFGNLGSGQQPLHTRVTAVRVLDSETMYDDSIGMYKTLNNIENVLESYSFQYVNLSLGPDLPIEDDDVSVWTSVLDGLLSSRDMLLSVAVGNNGELDAESGNNRIEPPGDAVNAICVGACDSENGYWTRAPYSAVGPGRSPGIVKPDLVAFGGIEANEFMVLAPGASPTAIPVMGTSFAAPNALRQAIRIREICGPEITPLLAKTLLIHAAERRKDDDQREVGWGRVPPDATEIVTTSDDRALIVYKGRIKPGKIVRATIPVPLHPGQGNIGIAATFSFICKVDPQSPDSYTRSALEVTFRRDANRVDEGRRTPNSTPFFSVSARGTSDLYSTESERRSDQGKWETVLHAEKSCKASTLVRPVLDIHYNAREEGGGSHTSNELEYALAITISAPKIKNLHQLILEKYPQLVSLEPVIDVDGGTM